MLCDGSPDPTIPGEINTFMNLWREEKDNVSIERVLEDSKLPLKVCTMHFLCSTCVQTCVCTYVRTHLCTFLHTCVCICSYSSLYLCSFIFVFVFMFVLLFVLMFILMFVLVYVLMLSCVRIYVHTGVRTVPKNLGGLGNDQSVLCYFIHNGNSYVV